MTLYNRYVERYNDNVDLLFRRALLAKKMQLFEQFEKDLRYIIELRPKNIQALIH